MIRVGGDFYYPMTTNQEPADVLFIGGGVGINPLFSMLSHHAHLLASSGKGSTRLLYSSKTASELLFRDRIGRLISDTGQDRVKVQYFVTAEECDSEDAVKCRYS